MAMTHRRIKKQAARWLIELDTAENIEEHWPKFEAWLYKNPEHRDAFVSMERAWHSVEDLRAFFVNDRSLNPPPLFKAEPPGTQADSLSKSPWFMRAVVVLMAAAWVAWLLTHRT
jgi:ferric-dicitrate binding protein FerR (iron transport regulator)